LANVLSGQGQLGDETRGLYERCVANSIRFGGTDGSDTASGNLNLGNFYYQLAGVQTTVDLQHRQLLLAKAYFEEIHRIGSKIYGPIHPDTVKVASQLELKFPCLKIRPLPRSDTSFALSLC
jgi:hypothetical protein